MSFNEPQSVLPRLKKSWAYTRAAIPRLTRTRLLVSIVTIVLILSVLSAVWINDIAGRANDLSEQLQTANVDINLGDGDGDSESLQAIQVQLKVAVAIANQLDEDMWPLRGVGAVLGWVPYLGDNITAPPDLVDRLVEDISAAHSLISSAQILLELFGSLEQQDGGLLAVLDGLPDQSEITAAAVLAERADMSLTRSEEIADGVRDGRLWGRLGSVAEDLRAQEGELRELTDWSLVATDSISLLVEMGAAADSLRPILSEDSQDPLTLDILDNMAELEAISAAALNAVSIAAASIPDGVSSPSVIATLHDLETLLAAVHGISKSGALVASVVSPAVETFQASDAGLFGPDSVLLEAIAEIGSGTDSLEQAHESLNTARNQLASARSSIESSWAVSSVESMLSGTEDLVKAVEFLKAMPLVAPDALGSFGERHYLVMAESADELRGSGGFVSGAWILTFDDGQLVSTVYHDIQHLDDLTILDRYPAPPTLLAKYMDAPVWLMRDVSWEPDFPSVARSAAEILALGLGGRQVDGVIAMTQWGLISLAETLGGIEMPAGPGRDIGLIAALEAGTDEEGREFMNKMFLTILDQVNSESVNDRFFPLAQVAAEMLDEKQTQVFFFDDDLQLVAQEAGWSGAFTVGDADRIAVIDSNVGWSKVDRNIERSLDYEVRLRESDSSTGTVTVTYHNMSPTTARGCDQQQFDRSYGTSYKELKQSCYWNLLRVFSAGGSQLLKADPLPLPIGSVYADLAFGSPGDDTIDVRVGQSGAFVSGLLVVPPGESRQTSLDFQLPGSVVAWGESNSAYRLELPVQAGILGRDIRIRVWLPEEHEYAGSSIAPTSEGDGWVEYNFVQTSDITLTLDMERSEPPFAFSRAGLIAVDGLDRPGR